LLLRGLRGPELAACDGGQRQCHRKRVVAEHEPAPLELVEHLLDKAYGLP